MSGPQGTDLYNDRQVSLPPLSHAPAPGDAMHPSQHGKVSSFTVGSALWLSPLMVGSLHDKFQ